LSREYTLELAKFVSESSFEDIPPQVVARTKLAILDALGIALGAYGTGHPLVKAIVNIAEISSQAKESTIIGNGRKVSCLDASWANSTLANILDFSDGHFAAGHINDRVVPPALAVAEREHATGKEFLASVLVGYEVYIRLAYSMFRTTEPASLRTPYFVALGPVAVSASAGRLLRLTPRQVAGAMGLASSIQICGAQYAMSGGNEKDLTSGHESRRGVLAALLAHEGVMGSTDILEGSSGLGKALSDGFQPDELLRGLGREYEITGCYFKPYSACKYLHSSIEAASKIWQKHKPAPNDIEKINIATNAASASRANYEIKSHVSAIFSHPYQVAVALREGGFDLPIYWEAKMRDGVIGELLKKTKMVSDPRFNEMYKTRLTGGATWPAEVEVQMKNGAIYKETVINPKGDPQSPMSPEEVREKFIKLALMALPRERVDRVLDAIGRLESIEDVNELSALLS
jgi:2-methylcitrate dehydratase PrpD